MSDSAAADPRVDDSDGGFAAADSPTLHPLTYPGRAVSTSVLLKYDAQLPVNVQPDRRIGQARVRVDEQGLPGDDLCAHTDVPLNYALLRLNEAPAGRRYPVLALGALAAPSYLRHRLDRPGHSLAIPMIQATAYGLGVGAAAVIDQFGCIPQTPVVDPTLTTDVVVQWLDERQIAELEDSRAGFARVLLRCGDPAYGSVQIELASGELLAACYVYVNEFGCLVDPETGELARPGDQAELLNQLLRRSKPLRETFGRNPEDLVERAQGIPASASTGIFRAEGWVRMQPVLDRLSEEPVPDRHYDTIPPAQPPPDGALRVLPSHDFLDRDGQSVVRMSRSLFDQRNRPKHVMVRPVLEGSDGSEVLALVLVDERSRETSAIEVDQAIRNAIGVEVGENVAIGPARVQRRRWPDWIIGRPTYVTARVQGADLAMVEREICLIDALTLELLGIESGEEVVLEGRSVNGGPVPQIRICAFATSNEIQQRRQDLDGGDASTLFPSSRDALGVYPDLPWVFLDRATRFSLGLHRKLAPVRIRSSRSFQLRRELREMMLLFGIAFIGVLQIIREPVWQLISLGFLVGLVLLSMAIRMRGRLSRRVHRMAGRFWLPSLPRR